MKELKNVIDKAVDDLNGTNPSTEEFEAKTKNLSRLVDSYKTISETDREKEEAQERKRSEKRKLDLEEKKLKIEQQRNEELQRATAAEKKSRFWEKFWTVTVGFAAAIIPGLVYYKADQEHRKDEKEDFYMVSSSGKANRNNMKAR